MRPVALSLLGVLIAGSALAQDTGVASSDDVSSSAESGMGNLLVKGYEIRAAVQNGTRYIVFLQKEKSAYACEFVSLTKSRCGSIN
ncbi:hypothetical protein QO002_002039 [Pararhizobium capsulatum DSM 1112]|uniref:Uncharacterized protein n=1 Tax=Pararhizobium capsulatum DSM 1112 TaxID=1121113 RepID=A0ABU0BNR3_9HYPH|nr:hypothetical protein [Pararhizobium capsulatum]MDQ0319901.1 hypothetical protein [Pararhizobium capsulatum DSM 1112]